MGRLLPHTAVARGKRVRVVTRGGEEIIGKFFDRTDRHIVLDCDTDKRRIAKSDLRSFGVYKGGSPDSA